MITQAVTAVYRSYTGRRLVAAVLVVIGVAIAAFILLHGREWGHLIEEGMLPGANPWSAVPQFGGTFFTLTINLADDVSAGASDQVIGGAEGAEGERMIAGGALNSRKRSVSYASSRSRPSANIAPGSAMSGTRNATSAVSKRSEPHPLEVRTW